MQLKVMGFNIEYGGEQVDFSGVINAIKAGGADVVGIEEGYGNMPKIAEEIGWKSSGPRSFAFDEDEHGFPLDPGEYSVHLLQDNSYNKLAAGHFTIRG